MVSEWLLPPALEAKAQAETDLPVTGCAGDHHEIGVRDAGVGPSELRRIREIEKLRAELCVDFLPKREVFQQAEIQVADTGIVKDVSAAGAPEVSSTAFGAQPPDLQPVPLMDMGFAISCPLARHRMPLIRFLSIGSRLCSTLPSDPASRRRPCASL